MKSIYIDIDETICTTPPNTFLIHNKQSRDYSKATPLPKRIAMVNKLYDDGHKITMWTARGTGTGIDWREVTEKQLAEWGVKHHELRMGKPAFDLFIDDKVLNSDRWTTQSVSQFFGF